MRMHKDRFVTKWVVAVLTSLGDACRETYTLPLIVMFINKEASTDILTRKRALQATMDSIERRYLGARYLGSYVFAGFMRWVSTVRVRMQIMRTDPTSKQINSCIEKPEFKALQYLHKLSQRILSWKRWPKKNMPFDELPNEFRDIKGDSDPPHAEYSHLFEVTQTLNAMASPEIRETMLAWFVAQRMGCALETSSKHRAYVLFAIFA